MSGTASRPSVAGALTALTVHGPRGVVALTVPEDATLLEVSRAYAAEAGLPGPLPLVTRSGQQLQPAARVADAGLVAGSVLVAVDAHPSAPSPHRAARPGDPGPSGIAPGAATGVWLAAAAALAAVAGWCASRLEYDDRWPAVVVLLLAAAVGCLPFGSVAVQRVLAAPAFAAAACFAVAWHPAPERLPTVLGAAALAGAVAAAVGRALADPHTDAEEGLRVWMAVGAGWFLVAGLGALAGVPPEVVWAVLFLLASLAARFVPEIAVDVPDSYLLDLERLAVTAWSARERPRGPRGRTVVPERAVGTVAARGARMVTASSVAVLVAVAVSGPLLLASADLPLDRVGARCLVGFGGAAVLFAARSYRHVLARCLLRVAGVLALAMVAFVVLDVAAGSRPGLVGALALATIALAGLLVLVAVLVGRGWRSAWWSRRAELGEAICGAFAVGSLVVAVGLFRFLWELTS